MQLCPPPTGARSSWTSDRGHFFSPTSDLTVVVVVALLFGLFVRVGNNTTERNECAISWGKKKKVLNN